MATIVFLHAASKPYTGVTLRQQALRGIESGTILLAEELVERGHHVSVYNTVEERSEFNGVQYRNFGELRSAFADLWICNNNMREFAAVAEKSSNRVVWMRNPTNIIRLFRKKNLLALCRFRPHGVFLSNSHNYAVSRILPFKTRRVIELGVDPIFLNTEIANKPRSPKAVFYSSFYRGVDWLLDTWRQYIHPYVPEAELHIVGDLKGRSSADLAAYNIIHHDPLPKPEIVELLRSCRILAYQGHWHEAGCNVAIEAFASGLPIVTRGIGVLGERVKHEESGLIGTSAHEFGAAAVRALTDDELWLAMHANVLGHWSVRPWSHRAEQWESAFL